jgi:hypothetical protein
MAFTAVPAAGAKLRASVLSTLMSERTPLYATVAVDQNLTTSSTTLQNVTSLVVAVSANATYQMDVMVAAAESSGVAEDIDVAFTFPAGATCFVYTLVAGTLGGVAGNSTTDMFVLASAATSGSTRYGAGLSTTVTNVILRCLLTVSSTSGNFQVQASQHTSGGNTVTVKASSYINGQRLL